MRERLVVVGNGMAGARFVEELLARQGGEGFDITVFGEEPHAGYNRILLTEFLGGPQDPRALFLHPLAWYEENHVRLHAGERVQEIRRAEKVVVCDRGPEAPYDRLVLATGSRPHVPGIAGMRSETGALRRGVFALRRLDDCMDLAAFADGRSRAAVLGGGLLGLETAAALRRRGVDVHIVHHGPYVMNRQLDPEAGTMVKRGLERMGIPVHLNRTTTAVLGERAVTGLRFSDGSELPCELVVVACGIRPNVELAAACGLAVEKALVVDDGLCTSDPAISAIGECAQHRGMVYGTVPPIWEQAAVLADRLAGVRPSVYRGSRVSTRLKVGGLDVAAFGLQEPAGDDELVQFSEPRRGIYTKLVIRRGRLSGAILVGDGRRASQLLQAFDGAAPLPGQRAALVFDLGCPAAAEELDEEATVCHCNGVRKKEIRECAEGGGRDLQAVARLTRAGTGCGSCKNLLRVLLDQYVGGRGGLSPGQVAGAGAVMSI